MATITGFTAARMLAIENNSVVDGEVDVNGDLILTRHGGGQINAGNVIGPTGSPGVSSVELDAALDGLSPVGTIVDYIGTVAPTKWLLLDGSTVLNGETLYPELWAILPAAMKSGSSILLPDARGRMTVGRKSTDTSFDTIGETGGSKDAVVVSHKHTTSDHQHSGPNHRHTTPHHTHSVSGSAANDGAHAHSVTGTTSYQPAHAHPPSGANRFVVQNATTGTGGVEVKSTSAATSGATNSDFTGNAGDHQHSIDGVAANAGTHQHSVTGTAELGGGSNTGYAGTELTGLAGGGDTSTVGASATNANLPPYIVFSKIIKAAA